MSNRLLIVILLFMTTSPLISWAQQRDLSLSDTLTVNRKLFTSSVLRNNIEIDNQRLALLLQSNIKWSKKFTISRILLPAGPVVAAGGIYLAYDAIKGIPMEAEIDGVVYPYTVRSLPKLLGGIALFVTGMSMIESANETKANAANWYNGYLIKELDKETTSIKKEIRLGVQESGRIGFVMKF